ncbi:Argininosuccinate lyase [Candidatus Norongarragalina meridionalis]|nr:Argininosuccinate lyase [Candidatus Norongarragalina meridionalis]
MGGEEFGNYQSPFSWRYGSPEMRSVFSEKRKRLAWRRVWVSLAKAEAKAGVVSSAELKDIEAHATAVDVAKALALEKELRHDLMAELKVYTSQCKKGGGKLHLGATSMDVEDNADVMLMKEALSLVKARAAALLKVVASQAKNHAKTPCLGLTHLQPAEPTTLGYRFAQYAQDITADLDALDALHLKGKGLKGAVGTSASYVALLHGRKMNAEQLEAAFLSELKLDAFEVATQTYPRKQDLLVMQALSSLSQTLHKMCLDVRIMQSRFEVLEPFGSKQVGSSAMPFKRNPISCERVCSLSRLLPAYEAIAWHNAANSALERTLDDSANRRIFVPEAFLTTDEMLSVATRVFDGLFVNEAQLRRNLDAFNAFAASEPLLMKLAEKGASRQEMHELIRRCSLRAWEDVQQGKRNPLPEMLGQATEIRRRLSDAEIATAFEQPHFGEAERKAKDVAEKALKRASQYAGVKTGEVF